MRGGNERTIEYSGGGRDGGTGRRRAASHSTVHGWATYVAREKHVLYTYDGKVQPFAPISSVRKVCRGPYFSCRTKRDGRHLCS